MSHAVAVDFRIEQRIPGSIDDVARAYTDPGLYATLGGLPKIGKPEVLAREEDGDTVRLRIRFRFVADLPSAATAVLDPKKLTWVEESTHDLAGHAVAWRLVPDNYGHRFRANGSSVYRSDGEVTVRQTKGDLVVKTPFVGRLVERALVSGMKEHLDAEAPRVAAWVAAHET
ncbi:MAG: DUF2505 family protein [Jiangellaceae bacterium]